MGLSAALGPPFSYPWAHDVALMSFRGTRDWDNGTSGAHPDRLDVDRKRDGVHGDPVSARDPLLLLALSAHPSPVGTYDEEFNRHRHKMAPDLGQFHPDLRQGHVRVHDVADLVVSQVSYVKLAARLGAPLSSVKLASCWLEQSSKSLRLAALRHDSP